MHLGARWCRFWHTLRGMFSGHLALTGWGYDATGERRELTLIACTCGRTFWRKG